VDDGEPDPCDGYVVVATHRFGELECFGPFADADAAADFVMRAREDPWPREFDDVDVDVLPWHRA
jgi:hypothetical protein